MLGQLKQFIRRSLERTGYEFRRIPTRLGLDPMKDIARLTCRRVGSARSVIFDVGAHHGQSIREFRQTFANPVIHAFEPTRSTFDELRAQVADLPDVIINNFALGARMEERTLLRYTSSDMNSVLKPDRDCWTEIEGEERIQMRTVDDYCRSAGIDHIDVIKSDTQGSDLEVLVGAEGMMRDRRVHLIYMEVIFSRMYERQADFEDILRHLRERGFGLVGLYRTWYQNDRLGWADALFVNSAGEGPAGRAEWVY